MYLNHFSLTEPPFTLTPDTEFFFDNGAHREALNVLRVALHGGEGFIKVTGEVGTGKTLLCRKLLGLLDDTCTAYIPNPFLNPVALRMALAEELGIKFARNIGQHRLLGLITERLIEYAAQDKQVVLLLDEVQAMPDETLEALRLLTNLETEKRKLMQVVLFGQPELDHRLSQKHLRQLRQRIVFSYQLGALDRHTLGKYIIHRLRVAGCDNPELFTARALKQIHRASRGIPRLVNLLCHKSMMAAYGAGATQIGVTYIRLAAKDTEDTCHSHRRRVAMASGLAGLLALTSAGLLYAYGL
ncbi:MSHA biogenesis protein MshM [Thiogranum longum]|uniref:MSHA biogenesis protein MshM n=2 Tax=Thiogranum longum TaxID=1537524 RepID=A0A4R1H9S3_9GAMM|nr:MSHA biogenesis protein MshM [Thiogranum longum]